MTQLCYSYLCIDCDEIIDIRDIRNGKCPRCGSGELYPLSAWIPANDQRRHRRESVENNETHQAL